MTLIRPPSTDAFEQFFTRRAATAKLGVFCVGLDNYWRQFPGLRERLLGYHAVLVARLRAMGHDVIDAGMSDSPEAAREAGDALRSANVDLVFCNVVTYSPAANALPVVQRAARPVVLVALQPAIALDYACATTVEQLANDNVTSQSEIACMG